MAGRQARGYHFQSKTRRRTASFWAWQLALKGREGTLVRPTVCALFTLFLHGAFSLQPGRGGERTAAGSSLQRGKLRLGRGAVTRLRSHGPREAELRFEIRDLLHLCSCQQARGAPRGPGPEVPRKDSRNHGRPGKWAEPPQRPPLKDYVARPSSLFLRNENPPRPQRPAPARPRLACPGGLGAGGPRSCTTHKICLQGISSAASSEFRESPRRCLLGTLEKRQRHPLPIS